MGKAEINMCLPFMKERAESFSNQIINITPNAILAVDMDLKVQQINQAACEIFKLTQEDIINQPVSRILDEFDFVHILTSNTEKYEKNAYLAEYNAYLNQIFLYDKASSMVVCIMKNITADRQKKNLNMKKKMLAAAMADDIADKQLRIVHEIASILGETAAETKIAIYDLKETILMDDEE
jgi:PAS domain S-box-containing protein